jgi:hypothetical protein
MDEPVLNFHFNVPVDDIEYRNPSSEPTKIVLLEITGDDLMASSVLNDQRKVSGGEILAGETPVSCAFPLKDGQFSAPAICAAAVRDVVRYRNDIRRRGFIFICFFYF